MRSHQTPWLAVPREHRLGSKNLSYLSNFELGTQSAQVRESLSFLKRSALGEVRCESTKAFARPDATPVT